MKTWGVERHQRGLTPQLFWQIKHCDTATTQIIIIIIIIIIKIWILDSQSNSQL